MTERTQQALLDNRGRALDYLRLSVTARCDRSCRYCKRQEGGADRSADGNELPLEEIVGIVRVLATLGISRVRLTGGEPLLRPALPSLARSLASIEGIRSLAITTNGARLRDTANELRSAGVSSLNLHLDSLKPAVHRWITGTDSLDASLAGIASARAAGFPEIKLNTVLMRGVNDGEIENLIALSASLEMPIRFIELMPMGAAASLFEKHFLPADEIIRRLSEQHGLLPLAGKRGDGPARYFHIPRSGAVVGFIGQSSGAACAGCNRLRLLSDGTLRRCLAEGGGLSLAGRLAREGEAALAKRIAAHIAGKPADHGGWPAATCAPTPMHAIGG